MRVLLSIWALAAVASAAILPDTIGPYHRGAVSQPSIAERALWDEYGLKEAEAARYDNGESHFSLTAYRLQDTTGSMAAFEWQRPTNSTASKISSMAAETADSAIAVYGNYILWFAGYKPSADEWKALSEGLNNVDTTPLPVLPSYLPSRGLTANSERYVTGPVGLAKFEPSIPPSVAGFHYGAEAQMGVFHSAKGDLRLAIFNYPTHHIAAQKVGDFEKLPGSPIVKRSGPLVAVALAPPDADFAEQLLSGVRYEAQVTRDEYVPTHRDNIGWVVISIFVLIGILLAASVASGVLWGAVRAFLRRGKPVPESDEMITLHLSGR
jgi:hypothetical protein